MFTNLHDVYGRQYSGLDVNASASWDMTKTNWAVRMATVGYYTTAAAIRANAGMLL